MFLEQLGVKGCYAVHGMASNDAEVRHADHLLVPFLDERESAFLVRVAWPFGFHFLEESFVDFENDL